MSRKYVIIALVIVAVLILSAGGYFLFARKAAPQQAAPVAQDEQQVLTLKPEDIGLTLSPITSGKFANNGVDMKITKLDGISSIDYELDYTAKGDLPRGAIGHIDVKPDQSTVDQQLAFGTCSDVCHFDSDVTNVKVTLKITKPDGKIYQVVAPYNQ